jgi:transposase
MSEDEWAFLAPFVIESGPRRGRRPRDHRLVLDGIFRIARTGAQWRDLPECFGKWSSVYRQFRRWTVSGLWELLLEILNDSGSGQATVQMIDSTIIRAHHCAAGAKGGLKARLLAVQEVALRPKFISAPTGKGCQLPLN